MDVSTVDHNGGKTSLGKVKLCGVVHVIGRQHTRTWCCVVCVHIQLCISMAICRKTRVKRADGACSRESLVKHMLTCGYAGGNLPSQCELTWKTL